jgi:phage gp29-like protein
MTPLLSLYRQIEVADDVIQGAMNSRKLAVLANPLRVEPFSAASVDVAAASRFSSCLDASPSFFDGVKHLLCSAVWPVSVSELRWLPGDLEYASFEMRNVPLEQLDYRSGDLRIARVDAGGHVGSESDYPDPARYIVHRGHLLTHPDTFGGPFRALIFWHLFGACNRDWWARFLERFGAPFLVGKYEADDEESRRVLEQAFSEAARTFGLVATSDTNIELHEAKSSVGSDAFDRFHDISTAAKTRLILGQTLSAKTDATGLGSGVANLQGRVREDYAAYDRLALADTLRRSLITPFMRINRLPGSPPRFV